MIYYLLLVGYLLIGCMWLVVDVDYFKTRVDNPLASILGITLWPLGMCIRLIQELIKIIKKC